MSLKGSVKVSRHRNLTKAEFEALRGTPAYLRMLRQQMSVTLERRQGQLTGDSRGEFQSTVEWWMNNNLKDIFYIQKMETSPTVFAHFHNEDDMFTFKLFWASLPYDSDNPINTGS